MYRTLISSVSLLYSTGRESMTRRVAATRLVVESSCNSLVTHVQGVFPPPTCNLAHNQEQSKTFLLLRDVQEGSGAAHSPPGSEWTFAVKRLGWLGCNYPPVPSDCAQLPRRGQWQLQLARLFVLAPINPICVTFCEEIALASAVI